MSALHAAGGDVSVADSAGLQPIHYAAQTGQTIILDFLIVAGADIEAKDKKV